MARTHLKGILNAALLRTTCSAAESMDARIQRIERTIFGDNIHERVRNAILFHLGGPDLDPRAASAHTSS